MSIAAVAGLVFLAAQGPVTDVPVTTTTVTTTSASAPVTARTTSPPVTTTTTSAGCALTSANVRNGELLWGLKKSFRQYVGVGLGGATGNSITASDGASVTNLDEVVIDGVPNPRGVPTGAYRFSFDSADYTSPSRFTAKFRGTVALAYPSHFFTLLVSNPQVSTSDGTTVLRADVELRTQPGAPANPVDLPGVELGKLTAPAATPSGGLLTWSSVPVTLANSEAFAGFYQTGTDLDPLTMRLGADCADTPPPPPTATVTPPPASSGEDLIPQARFRPSDGTPALAATGADIEHGLWAGVVIVLSGLALVLAAYRPRAHRR
ncbi:HtaA domain-containing protein [Lentzea sp. NPDC058436]|uniref:HtaA domain-containing protein n=1 Tax=Lentzea sp. NPDC058436 TaxID=3346499 RepID=UPI003656C34A